MDIRELLKKDIMLMDLKATSKAEVIDEMVHNFYEHDIIDNEEVYKKDIIKREEQSSTGMGDGIAIPHAHDEAVKTAAVQFARSINGVDYDSMDGQPAHLFFMIAAPEGGDNTHLQALAALSQVLMNPDVVAALKAAQTPDDVQDIFAKAIAEKEAENKAEEEAEKAAAANQNSDRPYIVAVTACPNGIAHTYMAEENLKKKAKELGVDIKVETNGSEGVKHRLTADEIARAAGVVIAADKKVEMARFDGKPLVNKPVTAGIQEPENLINAILEEKAAVYHATGDEEASSSESDGTVWGNIYKQLMNGISHMLPFVIGGGILMAISFIVEQYMGGAKSPAFIFLNSAGNLAFAFMVPVLAGYIAESIGDQPALMPGFVGGFMAAIANNSYGGAFHVNVQANAQSPAGFLGGIAIGFIAGYLIVGLKKLFSKLPSSLDGMKPMLLYPILGLLFVALIMYYIINPIFSSLNLAITNFLNGMGTGNLVILTMVLAGMMSIDMGGPFNKAAYVFASGAFANDPKSATAAILMASVMVGGMIPPFATAIGTAFFKNKYTENERRAGVTNWVLGFSFITEGAIPFATADPGRVIPSCIVGSAVGGALVGLMKVGVPAPHGGFWVAPLSTNILGYILAVVVGSIVAALILSFWKKPVEK